VSVVNARFVKPFDTSVLTQIAHDARAIVTIEEAQLRGGFGQAVAEYLLSSEYTGKFKALGIPDSFVTHGDRSELLRMCSSMWMGLPAKFVILFIRADSFRHARAAGFSSVCVSDGRTTISTRTAWRKFGLPGPIRNSPNISVGLRVRASTTIDATKFPCDCDLIGQYTDSTNCQNSG